MPAPSPRPDGRELRLVHAVLRREFELMPQTLVRAAAAGSPERRALLRRHWATVQAFLEAHHHTEDTLMWKIIRERAPHAEAIVARMEDQHRAMLAALEHASTEMDRWCHSGGPTDACASALTRLVHEVTSHFSAEEAEILPVMIDHLSPEDHAALTAHGRSSIPPEHSMLLTGMLVDALDALTAAAFLGAMPPPARTAWESGGATAYRHYVQQLRA